MNPDLAAEYRIPPELAAFIESGFLEFLSETPEEKTVKYHIPSRRVEDIKGRITSYCLIWIHPDFNAEYCHYYLDQPGDLPNFFVEANNSELGSETIPDIDTIDDLVDWLDAFQNADVR